MITNVFIVIRSSAERTAQLCKTLALREIPESNIAVIMEKPFQVAIRRTFEIGIESKLPWTLAIDADILLRPGAISDLVSSAEKLPETTFGSQGVILDKLSGIWRAGGPHLYRTSLLELAGKHIPDERDTLIPEHVISRIMNVFGFPYIQTRERYGIHDFHQYYCDIFRKAFVRGRKHPELMEKSAIAWKSLVESDADYLMALIGLDWSRRHQGDTKLDTRHYSTMANQSMAEYGITEKAHLLSEDELNQPDIGRLCHIDALPGFQSANYTGKRTYTGAIAAIFNRYGRIGAVPWIAGRAIEKLGGSIKDKAEYFKRESRSNE